MSKSMPPPWLREWAVSLLQEAGKVESGKAQKKWKANKLKSRLVQVIGVDDEWKALTLNDRSNTVTAMLTADCYDAIVKELGSLEDLRNSIVTLSAGCYHMSTVYQCAGTRDVKKMRGGKGLTLPLAVQVSSLSFTGASDLDVMMMEGLDQIIDLNHSKEVKEVLSSFTYVTMVGKFGALQFPKEGYLPDANGVFDLPPRFSDQHQLKPSHSIVPKYQQHMLDKIDTYDRVRIVELVSLADKNLMAAADVDSEEGNGGLGPFSSPEKDRLISSSGKDKRISSRGRNTKSPGSAPGSEGRQLTEAERRTLLMTTVSHISEAASARPQTQVNSQGMVPPAPSSSSSSQRTVSSGPQVSEQAREDYLMASPPRTQARSHSGSQPQSGPHSPSRTPGSSPRFGVAPLGAFTDRVPDNFSCECHVKSAWNRYIHDVYPNLDAKSINSSYVWLMVYASLEYPGKLVVYKNKKVFDSLQSSKTPDVLCPAAGANYSFGQWQFQLRKDNYICPINRKDVLMELPLHLIETVNIEESDAVGRGWRVKLHLKNGTKPEGEKNGLTTNIRFRNRIIAHTWAGHIIRWMEFASARERWAQNLRRLIVQSGLPMEEYLRRGMNPSISAAAVTSPVSSNNANARDTPRQRIENSSRSQSQSQSQSQIEPETQAPGDESFGPPPAPPSSALMTEENIAAEEMWFNGTLAQSTASSQVPAASTSSHGATVSTTSQKTYQSSGKRGKMHVSGLVGGEVGALGRSTGKEETNTLMNDADDNHGIDVDDNGGLEGGARRRTRLSMEDEDSLASTGGEVVDSGSASKTPVHTPTSPANPSSSSQSVRASGRQSLSGTSSSNNSVVRQGIPESSPSYLLRGQRDAEQEKVANKSLSPKGVGAPLIGVTIRKEFKGHGSFTGKVVSYDSPYYRIHYPYDEKHPDQDSDYEEMDPDEVEAYMVNEHVEAQFTQTPIEPESEPEPEPEPEVEADEGNSSVDMKVETHEQLPVEAKGVTRKRGKGRKAGGETERRSSSRRTSKRSFLQDSDDSDEEPSKPEMNRSSSVKKRGRPSKSRSSSRSTSSSSSSSSSSGIMEQKLTLESRQKSLSKLSSVDLQTLQERARNLVQRHHANASTFSPVRPTSQKTRDSLNGRVYQGKSPTRVKNVRGAALDRRVKNHLASLKDGEAPAPEIYRFMTSHEKELIKEKRMSSLIKQWEQNAVNTQERAQKQSPGKIFESIRKILTQESVEDINKEIDRLVENGESKKDAYRMVMMDIGDQAAALVAEGYTAADGGIFYPETSANASSGSSSSSAPPSRRSRDSFIGTGSAGKVSRSMSVSASRKARQPSFESVDASIRQYSTEGDGQLSDQEASVHTQTGPDNDDLDFPEATQTQPEIAQESLPLADSDDDKQGHHQSTPATRRYSGLNSGSKKRRLSEAMERSAKPSLQKDGLRTTEGRGSFGRYRSSEEDQITRRSSEASSRNASSPMSPSPSPRPSPATLNITTGTAESSKAVTDKKEAKIAERKRKAVEAARRNMAKKAARLLL